MMFFDYRVFYDGDFIGFVKAFGEEDAKNRAYMGFSTSASKYSGWSVDRITVERYGY